jgi:S-adenosylmethionine hydrolase
VSPGHIDAEVFGVDRFGNVQLSAGSSELERAGLAGTDRLEVVTRRARMPVRRAATFGDVTEGEVALIVDSSGRLALVLNRGSAAEALDLASGDSLSIQAQG